MGKSGKKVKSDKINALRKQYDAFLEDDKKRKDRNEYILGRLDEMRLSTALIQPKSKSKLFDHNPKMPLQETSNYISNPLRMQGNTKYFETQTNMPVEYHPKQIEVSIIREITKNYILIPKVQSFLPSNHLHNNSSSEIIDTDWKCKYNILNELKQNEKESVSDYDEKPIDCVTHDVVSANMQDTKRNDSNINKNDPVRPIDIPVFPNSDSIKTRTITDNIARNNSPEEKEEIKNVNQERSQKNDNENHKKEIHLYPNNVIASEHEEHLNSKETNENDQNYNKPQELQNVSMNISEIISENKEYDHKIKESITNPNMEKTNVHIKNDLEELPQKDEIYTTEIVQNNLDHAENEENIVDNQKYETKDEQLNVEDSTLNNLEVNELEKEQNEMFYTETTEKNIEYDENNVVDQPSEYPADNENYTNEQYSYYDEQQQQQYPSEINEHEESTEQYDPNYQQQYAENYENVPQYDNQQYQEQYQVDNNYEQQEPVISSEGYDESQQNNEHFEPLPLEHTDAYQTDQGDAYTLENQAVSENQNFEAEQYYNDQQEYSTEIPTEISTEQYVQEEYNQMNPVTTDNMQEVLYREESKIDSQNTALGDNIVEPNIPDNTAIETESSLQVS